MRTARRVRLSGAASRESLNAGSESASPQAGLYVGEGLCCVCGRPESQQQAIIIIYDIRAIAKAKVKDRRTSRRTPTKAALLDDGGPLAATADGQPETTTAAAPCERVGAAGGCPPIRRFSPSTCNYSEITQEAPALLFAGGDSR